MTLQELSDRQAIVDLINAYCLHFDQNEPEAVAALFTDEARFERTADGWRIADLVLRAAGTVDFHRATMHPIGRRGQ